MAAGVAVLEYMDKHDLLDNAAKMGEYLGQRLEELLIHPSVGDVRGKGLMWGLEFVRDKATKETFDPQQLFHFMVYEAARKKSLVLLPSGGCDRGQAGDMALLGPPLIITQTQIDEMVGILDEALTHVERDVNLG